MGETGEVEAVDDGSTARKGRNEKEKKKKKKEKKRAVHPEASEASLLKP